MLSDVSKTPPPPDHQSHLTPTDDPNVFLNEYGSKVDKNGVLLALFSAFATSDAERDIAIIGKKVETPAELLKRVALDPTVPIMVRLDAAKAAAPYYDKKQPTVVESGGSVQTFDMAAIAALPKEQRVQLLDMLSRIGVNIGLDKRQTNQE